MTPNGQHHVWCNEQYGPVEECDQCSGPKGHLKLYPMDDMTEEDAIAKYFPNVKRVGDR